MFTIEVQRIIELGKDIVTPTESNQTTHFSVVDAAGNAVSNTYTLEGGYGSGVVAALAAGVGSAMALVEVQLSSRCCSITRETTP